ncbi:hypothetical protein LAC81_35700 (plasmid) [Ensifer adhaerens]|uniref:hypothetical protein n=1 Tax=Ensifer adhaerens TaxID=106592 RepID=UPI001CBE53FD|nr:hypothetical protein [Ensifer adhaerens]MBZ7927287.1 hypothetical protein [Ensifer adhaerens]UAX98302.1 hypothetical protein LAC78_37000 [Ensifer adhaerens]UAY05685.1 hypothetical protein LAC80_35705 [Ensifer adhaerens]UAY13063.1 hypothetical protein LAC81_35700 [Ensifer adhaerens]
MAKTGTIRRQLSQFGWAVIFLLFGVLGGRALFAPLRGAMVANGVVKVPRPECDQSLSL